MPFHLLLLLITASPADTLRLPAAELLRRAVAQGDAVRAARRRADAAEKLIGRAGAWRNPLLTVTAENLGAQRQVTGRDGLAGTEGQATLEWYLTLGGDRGAALREARALADAARLGADLTEADLGEAAVAAAALAERDAAVARHATEEADALDRFAEAMSRRALEGRNAGGEAARARLEAATARSGAGRRAALAARSEAELARLVGAAPGQPVQVEPLACGPAEGAAPAAGVTASPDVARADALARAAGAARDRARAAQVPDLRPITGFRRTAGFSGLLFGLALEVPLLQAGGAAKAAATAEAEAAAADRAALARRLEAEAAGTAGALGALDAAGRRFDAAWRADLDRAVSAASARFDAGEGTLVELLDARRARVQALDEYETWRAERRLARARAARLAGRPIDERTLCDDHPGDAR